MRSRIALVLAASLAAASGAPARADASCVAGPVSATVGATSVTLSNGLVSRAWSRGSLATTALSGAGLSFTRPQPDFALVLDGQRITSDRLPVADVAASGVSGGCRLTWVLLAPGVAEVTRVVEAYAGVAGFGAQTTVTALAPLALSGYTLDEVAVGSDAAATIHAFRAGADWRMDTGWNPVAVGDAHQGDWRVETSRARGQRLEGPGEWLSLRFSGGQRVALVQERRDYASSRMAYDGTVASAVVDLSRDVVYLGPLEEDAHAENPGPGPARHRALVPGRALPLEPSFTVVAADRDDEPWQVHRYLRRRLGPQPYRKAVTFNTNNVDGNAISTGAKDDVNYARFLTLAQAAREMGVDTFIFDDGWQALAGDWCPDSEACPEPRRGTSPKFEPRFPDDRFEAVQEVLRNGTADPADDIALGLWMTPMEFHPSSRAFRTNPQWACAPVGHGTAALNAADPNSSSNESGIGVWNPLALGVHPDTGATMRLVDYMEDRIRRAIENYGATYFKFDYMVWIDCGGAEPVDLYAYHDAFLEMVDRLRAAHPEVTFQVDETNDYRMFPFESVARGPSWFQNGNPTSDLLLHNLWNLAPHVPGSSLGQGALGNAADRAARGIDALMAVALGSHITFWTQIDAALTSAQRAQVRRWTDLYRAHRDRLGGFAYPLLADPVLRDWTALQPWDPEARRGFLLAYRQASGQADRYVALRGVRGDGSFCLTRHDPAAGPASPCDAGVVSAAQLRAGIPVHIAQPWGYAIVEVAPA